MCASPSNIQFVPNEEILSPNLLFDCTAENPQIFGLKLFSITVELKEFQGSYSFDITFYGLQKDFGVSARVEIIGETIVLTDVIQPDMQDMVSFATGAVLFIELFSRDKTKSATYKITFSYDNGNFSIKTNTAIISFQYNNYSIIPSFGAENTIEGRIYLTQDSEQICLLEYITKSKHASNYYKEYCIDLSKVIRGEKKTLEESILFLERKGYNVNKDLLLAYSSLRLILSELVFCSFSTTYLRRGYYREFLFLLEESIWREFLEYFTDPQYGVTNYYKFFVK